MIQEIQGLGVEAFEVSKHVFEKISYRDRPDGLLAVAKETHLTLQDLDYKLSGKNPPFFLIAEAIEKPGNLGSILRSADAAGVDALFVCDRCTDIYNPNAEVSLAWNDPAIGVEWPLVNGEPPALSDKDANGLSFADAPKF